MIKNTSILQTIFFILLSLRLFAQKPNSLPVSTPEAQGVPSRAIIDFLDGISNSKNEFHSFMILRHGKIIAQGWWNPYRADLKHTMYSVSKSFTATAVGFAIAEKKLSVDDKVISFFPNELPDTVSPYLAALRVKDLLSMSVGMQPDPTGQIAANNDDWIKAFFKTPIINQPGTKFLYNSAASFMLSAIVQKVTGKKTLAYLQQKLFNPLAIQGIDWELNPQGINTGGWGLRLKTEDMAKFGQLFLQKGMWNGKQILPQSWVTEASTKKIDQDPSAPQSKKDSSDWLQGYCYQMWRCRNNEYRGDGAFGQYIIVMPDKDAVIVVTSETSNMQSELNLVWKHLLPAFKNKALAPDNKMQVTLKEKIASLALPVEKAGSSDMESKISGKTFTIDSVNSALKNIHFEFKDGNCLLSLETDSATHTIGFGKNKWIQGETTKRGPYLVSLARANRTGLSPYKIAGNYKWKDEKTLELTLRYIESPHTEYITFAFNDTNVKIDFENSFNKANEVIYKATLTAVSGSGKEIYAYKKGK